MAENETSKSILSSALKSLRDQFGRTATADEATLQKQVSDNGLNTKNLTESNEINAGQTVSRHIGTKEDDAIITTNSSSVAEKVNGNAGNDLLGTGEGNDLAAGDMVGDEWTFANGKWTFDASKVVSDGNGSLPSYDDTIVAGDGDDVILGNGGNDQLYSGAGDDTINAGDGNDVAFGGAGDDLINLEDGDDAAEGGLGADTINAGDGNDLVYGDNFASSILSASDGATSFSQYDATGDWDVSEEGGQTSMTQSVQTTQGVSYTLTFDLAANLSGGSTCGAVEVLWNGEVVGSVETNSGVYETHSIDVPGVAGEGKLSFRELTPPVLEGPEIDTSGPIFSYKAEVKIGEEDVTVAGFAPGQNNLYQVIDGQLKVFDTETNQYSNAGDSTGLKVNAIGFNIEDDLIYGIAKASGVDFLGNPVSVKDLVMMDADGNAYRIGETPTADYVGDFDNTGNLWTFSSKMDNVHKIDVNNLDANGNPEVTIYDLPNDLFNGRIYDIAYNEDQDAFFAVEAPAKNGGAATVHRIDMSKVEDGENPEISSLPITSTLYGDEISEGVTKGAYGAVFLDGEGNLFYGLNRGDHDLDGSTGASGGIFKVNMDWGAGTAYAEYMADAQSTGSNDGAVDPRSSDAFGEIDTESTFLIRDPQLTAEEGGNDDLRGGDGEDEMYGGAGADTLHGGNDDDVLSGDSGNDKVFGGEGNDNMAGGNGDDKLIGGSGKDEMSGDDGNDYVNGGTGDDVLIGGAGADKIVGGSGSDIIIGGKGNDNLWGGNWWKDGETDTFFVTCGGGKDMIHDFESDKDQIDLSSYGLEFSDVSALMTNKGWATEIDLSGLKGGQSGDKLIIKSVDPDDLDESNFIL